MHDPGDQLTCARSGEVYDDLTKELVQARERAALLTSCDNTSFGAASLEREALLRGLLGGMGARVHFEPTLRCDSAEALAATTQRRSRVRSSRRNG